MKKSLITLAVLTAFVTPAFAQSLCECNGTGNVLPFGSRSAAFQNGKIAAGSSGLNAFAMVPMAGPVVDSDSPAATGGGSAGYNAALRSY